MRKIVVALFFIIALFPSFAGAAGIPRDFRVEYARDGGLYPERTSLNLSEQGGTYRHYYNGAEQIVRFSVSAKELSSMNNLFRWYFFSSIKTRQQDNVYDRGGDSISLTQDGKTIVKSNTGNSYLNGSLSRWRYNRIAGGINSFIQKKLTAHYRTFTIEVESHLSYFDNIQMAMNGAKIADLNKVKVLPGTNELIVALYDSAGEWVTEQAFIVESSEISIARVQVRGRDISVSTE